jgi:very-short-patch-repair endonuclease
MGGSSQQASCIWRLAARQHGVVTHRQLLSLGFTRHAIQHRIARGRLHAVARGVYAVGRPELTQRGRWMAAVLCCGDGGVLSHRSAGELWGVYGEGRRPSEVTAVSPADLRRPGIRVHRRPSLTDDDLAVHDGIPVTSIVRTLLDLATILTPQQLERAVNETDRLDLTDPERLRTALGERAGQRGVRVLRTLLDRRTFRMTDSELERRFLPIVDSLGLERPLTRQQVNGFRVDFHWPALGLVVECDGLRYHRTPAQQARDRLRDQAHTAAGLVPLRFTHEQVRYRPHHVRRTLETVLRRLGARAA